MKMKRQIFTLLVVLALATTALMAQSTATPNPQLPPSQQVDQSGQPEQSGRPDVDVDTGKNANNGVLDVDVKRNGDSDTKAGNNPNGNAVDTTGTMGTTGTTGGNTGTTGTTGQYSGSSTSTTTTTGTDNAGTGVSGSGGSSLPRTASDMPLFGLLGALALAGALGLRQIR
jgi:cobalamin biosynthesis Mg chelatase CobN